jgi:hypothetical protein
MLPSQQSSLSVVLLQTYIQNHRKFIQIHNIWICCIKIIQTRCQKSARKMIWGSHKLFMFYQVSSYDYPKWKVKQCSLWIKNRMLCHCHSLHLKPYHYILLDTTILMETCPMIRKNKCSLPALVNELGYACTAQVHIICLSVDSSGTRCFPSHKRPTYSHLEYKV